MDADERDVVSVVGVGVGVVVNAVDDVFRQFQLFQFFKQIDVHNAEGHACINFLLEFPRGRVPWVFNKVQASGRISTCGCGCGCTCA